LCRNALWRWARAINVRVSAARAHYTITDRAAPLEQGWSNSLSATGTCARRRARGPCSGLLTATVRCTRYVAIEWPRVPSSSAWPMACGRTVAPSLARTARLTGTDAVPCSGRSPSAARPFSAIYRPVAGLTMRHVTHFDTNLFLFSLPTTDQDILVRASNTSHW